MRVLSITNTFPPGYTGGAEIANYHSCRGLIQQGIDCSMLVLNNRISDSADEWYELDGIPVHRVTYMLPRCAVTDVFDWRFYRVVRSELRRLSPDLVHIYNVSGATLAPHLACRSLGVPVVNTLHDLWLLCPNNMLYRADGSFCDPRQQRVDCRRCFRRYDFWANVPYRRRLFAALTSNVRLFISPSQALIERHAEAGYAVERFRLVRYGFAKPVPERLSFSRFDHLMEDDHVQRTLVFAGGGVEIKGVGVLLEALPDMLRSTEHQRLIIAGGGEQRILNQFRQYAPHVQVLGVVSAADMHALFAIADLTIVPSICHENLPVVISESFQAGVPAVGSRIGGIPELIRHGDTGYLFPVGDPAALAETIRCHFARPAVERRRMRLRCVQEVRTRFTLQKHVRALREVYREVLRGS
jgi:glycosyltransferase involved in cell wall biosynthesis